MFHKLDNAQLSAGSVSEGKARTALDFKRPSKALDDAIAAGGAGMRLLALKNITPIEGGVLILVDGKIAGAIGVSGALSSQDAQVAAAGAAVLAKRDVTVTCPAIGMHSRFRLSRLQLTPPSARSPRPHSRRGRRR